MAISATVAPAAVNAYSTPLLIIAKPPIAALFERIKGALDILRLRVNLALPGELNVSRKSLRACKNGR